jgi:hypothetical protein
LIRLAPYSPSESNSTTRRLEGLLLVRRQEEIAVVNNILHARNTNSTNI